MQLTICMNKHDWQNERCPSVDEMTSRIGRGEVGNTNLKVIKNKGKKSIYEVLQAISKNDL